MKPEILNNVDPTSQSNNNPKQAANIGKKKILKSPYNAHLK